MADFFFLAPEIVLPFSPLNAEHFNKIRMQAEKTWKNEIQWSDNSPTTYRAHFRSKTVDDPPRIQPYSETRLNNPHPHELFLVNKVHYLPGYYNSRPPEHEKPKATCTDITRFFKDSMHVNHRVMHQVVHPDVCITATQKNFDTRSKSAKYGTMRSSAPKRRIISSQGGVAHKWSSSSQSSGDKI
ncbi:uncharacterized protein C4orf51 homolog [Monodelphis domestica]|uniref:uncharacterized protein C4orf51 homolog n=1 Tax=Monodelphis domestica TaxID=13616 RepID=UPI0024E1F17A|nr:uncharacterized protein C4orf51 homolog [Monodelphis domestica]